MRNRNLWITLAVIGFITAAVLGWALGGRLARWQFASEPVHATVEAAGAVIAVVTAVFLLIRGRDVFGGKSLPIALGFLGMGLLDGIHAATPPGNNFVLLHNMAILAGGAWFALVWVPRPERFERHKASLTFIAAAGAASLGLWVYTTAAPLPVMLTDGKFSAVAREINLLSGALFMAAAVRLLLDFRHTGSRDCYVFACLAVLLGLAGLTFNYSTLWDGTWWAWHLLRLTAFALVLGWVIAKHRHRTRQAEEAASERGKHLALGADVGRALITAPGLRAALQGCAEAMVRHLDAAFARIWILNEDEQVLELLASAGMYTRTDGFHSKLDLWKYPYKIAVIGRERRPHLTNEVIGDPMVHDQDWAKREGMVAFAGYPLVFKERLVGVVGMFAKHKLTPGALKALESVADEITIGVERIRSSESLRLSEEMLQSLVEESLAGAYIIQDGMLKFVNQALADIYGYSKEELYSFRIEDITLPEDFPRENALNLRLLMGELPNIRYEARRLRKDGRVIALDMMRWMTEYRGRPAIIGTALDITERKRAEDALRESEAKFRGLSEGALIGISMVQDFRHVYANAEFCRMLGYTESEILEMDMFLLVHPEDREQAREGIASILSGREEKVRYQARWVRKDGKVIDIEGTATAATYKGRPALISTALDITERKALEREKTDFLAMVTHDFKSPLTNILGFTELLLEGRDKSPDEVREMVSAVYRSGKKLSGMVEDFLFHSKLETGAAVPDKIPGNLYDLLKCVCDEYSPQAEGKSLDLRLEASPRLPRIFFDRRLLERAVQNLLQNAVTYTPEGGSIAVKADFRTGADGDFAEITVSDTGPGIPQELQPKVFEKYFRSPTTAGVRGTGLGLAVVKLVADAHNGKAEVDCKEGAGCTFRIVLPVNTGKNRSAA